MPQFTARIARGYRDKVRVERDAAPSGSQAPEYKTLISRLPCFIEFVGGDERLRGLQLESHITNVVESEYLVEYGNFEGNMRMIVLEGPLFNMILNVEYVLPIRRPGRAFQMNWFCRMLD